MDLLVVSYHFPPDEAIGGIRPYQFARLLPQFGVRTWVLTVQPEYAWHLNPAQEPAGIPPEHIIRTPVLPCRRDRIEGILHRLKRTVRRGEQHREPGAIEERPPRKKNLLQSCIVEAIEYPDRYAGWIRPAVSGAQQLHERVRFSAVYTTSPPKSCALIGLALAERYRLPWIFDLRDPWLTDEEGWRTTIRCRIVRRWHERAFNACLERSTMVLVNSFALGDYLKQNYARFAEKIRTLPNGIDDEMPISTAPAPRTERLTIGHFGTIYGQRTSAAFLKGLAQWLQRHPDRRQHVEALFYGRIFEDIQATIQQYSLGDVVHVRGLVPRAQAAEIQSQCTALLLLAQKQPLQVPGKVYEYLASGKPIIAMTERNSATGRLLQTAAACYTAEDEQGVVQVLDELWQAYSSGENLHADRSATLEPLRYSHLAEDLAALVKQVAGASQ